MADWGFNPTTFQAGGATVALVIASIALMIAGMNAKAANRSADAAAKKVLKQLHGPRRLHLEKLNSGPALGLG